MSGKWIPDHQKNILLSSNTQLYILSEGEQWCMHARHNVMDQLNGRNKRKDITSVFSLLHLSGSQ